MDIKAMMAEYGLDYDDKLLHLTDFRIDTEYHGPIRLSVEFVVDPLQNFPKAPIIPTRAPWPPPQPPVQVMGTRKRSDASPLKAYDEYE